jgi:RNA polymerase sigma factor (sigma-70 family)|tara:strand:- start:736 stop:1230 length:495 start_codon:yes stop_codon:yes gene_type:complete
LTTLEKIASKHKDWVRIVKSFGCDGDKCEDIVQEMYLKVHTLIKKGIDISYDDDINHFYIYRILRSLFIDLCRKEKKITKVNIEYLERFVEEEEATNDKDILGKMQQLNNLLDKVYWYDKKVFDLVSDGMSIAELSKKSGISYYSLYNTYKNVKSLIKQEIKWD